MFPSEKKLLKLLSNNDVTFYIPPYQRNYEWTNEQCKVFFDDIIKTAEANLGNRRVEHFFGTITYFESEQKFGEPSKLILIDGQQRITTTMLFLVALRDITTVDKSRIGSRVGKLNDKTYGLIIKKLQRILNMN